MEKSFLLFLEIYIAANHVSEKDLFWNPSRLGKGAGNILLPQALLASLHLLELSALLVARKKLLWFWFYESRWKTSPESY